MIYFDITNLITYARDNLNVSGIQRVTLEALRNLDELQTPFFLSRHTNKWYCVHGLKLKTVENLEDFRHLAKLADLCGTFNIDNYRIHTREYIKSHKKSFKEKMFLFGLKIVGINILLVHIMRKVNFRRLKHQMSKFRTTTLPSITPQDTLCFFGASWDFQHQYLQFLTNVPKTTKRVFCIYDLIPLVSPYVPDDLRNKFQVFIPWAISQATLIIVNSTSCQNDLIAFSKRNNQMLPPIIKVQLSHRLPKTIDTFKDTQNMALRVRKMINEKFVLCVGSIESRKNHLNLLIMWAKFVRSEYYANEKLVIAGRWTWDVHTVQNFLHETGHIDGSVIVMDPAPSDEELQQLYHFCRFSVFPSHYEGWGLPVGESLSFGKPCITFDNSALKEVGWGLSHVVGNYDYAEYYNQLVKLMGDDVYYQESVKHIRSNSGILRSWSDFSNDIYTIFAKAELQRNEITGSF